MEAEVEDVTGEGEEGGGAGGGSATYVNWSALESWLVPPGVVTVMSTVPAEWGGADALTDPSATSAVNGTNTPPKSTEVTPVRKLPPMVTVVPPDVLP